MSVIILPEKWTKQPTGQLRLDQNSPLSFGIKFLQSGPNYAPWGGSNKPTSKVKVRDAYSLEYVSANNHRLELASGGLTTYPLTLGAIGIPSSSGVARAIISVGSNSTAERISLQFNFINFVQILSADTVSTDVSYADRAVALNERAVCVGVVAGANYRRVYVNGVAYAPSYASRVVTGLGTVAIGASWASGSPSAMMDGKIPLAVVWGRALSNAEALEWSINPWQIFRRDPACVYFLPSAGGGGATITPIGLSSSAFGSFSVNAGDRILTFTGKASDEAFGTFNLRARNKILLTGKSSNEAFGSFNVYPGKVILLPNSKTSDNAIGSSSLLSGQKLINPVAKTTDNAFGSFIIISGDRILLINGIASSEAFGPFSVNNNTATQNVLPSGYFDSAFGSFSLRPDQYIIFEGKEYLEFGQFLLSGSAVVRAKHFFDWVSQQPGLRGSMNDKLYQYLRDHGFTGSTPTMLFLWLRSLGYVGNTATMLTAFERDYTTRWH